MAKTGRAKSTQPATTKDKKNLLRIRTRDVVTRVGISAAGGRSKSRVQPARLQEPARTNIVRGTPIDRRLTSRLGQLLVIILTPFETPSKALFLASIRIFRLQLLRRRVKRSTAHFRL